MLLYNIIDKRNSATEIYQFNFEDQDIVNPKKGMKFFKLHKQNIIDLNSALDISNNFKKKQDVVFYIRIGGVEGIVSSERLKMSYHLVIGVFKHQNKLYTYLTL